MAERDEQEDRESDLVPVEEGEGGSDSVAEVLKNLEAEITCGICHDHYRDPKVLPCFHCYCRKCVKSLIQYAKGKPFSCPMCNEPTTLPMQGGVDAFPSAFFVTKLVDTFNAIDGNKAELRQPQKLTCDLCKKGDVQSYCNTCDQFLCTQCSQTHKTMAAFSKHKFMSLEEFKSKRDRGSFSLRSLSLARSDSISSYAGELSRIRSMSSTDGKKRSMCLKHNDPIKVYCHDHDQLICRDCTVYEHRDCRTGFIRDTAPKTRQALADALVPLQKAHESVLASEQEVESIEVQVGSQEMRLLESARQSFDQLRSRVDTCEATLLQGIKTVGQGKKDALTGQRKALQIAKKEVDNTIDTVKQDLDNLTDEELMGNHRALEMQLQKELARHRNRVLEPATTADIVCEAPSPNVLPTKLGLAYPKCDLRRLQFTPPATAFVGSKADFSINVPYSLGERIEVDFESRVDSCCVIHAHVKPWAQKDAVQRGVIVGRYDVIFTPRVRGPHKLKVKINGEEIPGSPFNVFVEIDPKHLGYIVRESGEAGKPYGIALTPEGELVVAGNGSKELKFWTRDLKETGRSIRCDKFHYPRGVAAGKNGVIYSTDKGIEAARDYTIMKFDGGHLVKGSSYGSRNVRMIKIIRNYIFVADERGSQVHKFSLDLDFIATFSTKQASDTHDIAEHQDHLYVVGNSKIAIYTFEGKFVNVVPINYKGSSLSLMRGICFDRGGNMFVTVAAGLSGVYVFKPTGEFLTSFGHFMDHSCGIVIDDNGFVYVTDHKPKNRKIYVF